MTAIRRFCQSAVLLFGFVLLVGGGLVAFYVAPAFREISYRPWIGLAGVAGCLVGIALIAKFYAKVEAATKPRSEPHIPGLDADVEE